MTTHNLNLFGAIYANMNYLGQKQKVIANNIANADTPNFQAQELRGQPNFKKILGASAQRGNGVSNPYLRNTSANHLDAAGRKEGQPREVFRDRNQKTTYEIAPSGNSVILEEQMIKASEVAIEHRMMSNIHEKYVRMMRAATGNGQ